MGGFSCRIGEVLSHELRRRNHVVDMDDVDVSFCKSKIESRSDHSLEGHEYRFRADLLLWSDPDAATLIHCAVLNASVDVVAYLLTYVPDVNFVLPSTMTCIQGKNWKTRRPCCSGLLSALAARHRPGRVEVFELLRAKGLDCVVPPDCGHSFFSKALLIDPCKSQDRCQYRALVTEEDSKVNLIRCMLDAGANPCICNEEDSLFHDAVCLGRIDVCRLLLSRGYRKELIEGPEGSHRAPIVHILHSDGGSLDMLKFFVSEVKMDLSKFREKGDSTDLLCLCLGDEGLDSGVNSAFVTELAHYTDPNFELPVPMGWADGFTVPDLFPQLQRWSVLFLAVTTGHLDVARVLLNRGARVDWQWPLLITHLFLEGQLELMLGFRPHHADLQAKLVSGPLQVSALQNACEGNRPRMVATLLRYGALVEPHIKQNLKRYSKDVQQELVRPFRCISCGASRKSKDDLFLCPNCECVYYCSKHCQSTHMAAGHKAQCARWRKK